MNLKLNKIIKYLIYSDLVFYTGWGLISPIFALFLVGNLKLTAFVVGMSAAINLIVRSLLRIPFGISADKSQKRAYRFMFWGLFVSALIPIGYIYSTSAWHIYLLQGVLGASLALSTAGWTGIFARYMDRKKGSTQWGIDAVAVGIGPGIAGALGGLAVTLFSFNLVFIAVTIIGLIGTFILLAVRKNIMRNSSLTGEIFAEHEVRRMKKASLK